MKAWCIIMMTKQPKIWWNISCWNKTMITRNYFNNYMDMSYHEWCGGKETKLRSVKLHLITYITFSDLGFPWASYQIRKIAGCACAGNAGNVSPRRQFQRKPLVSDPGMHHGTCVTHVPWCMSGSLTCDDGENVPGIPGACAPAILRIWQEAHARVQGICMPFPDMTHMLARDSIEYTRNPSLRNRGTFPT